MLSGAAEETLMFCAFIKEKQDQLIKSHMLFSITETDGLYLYLTSCLIFCNWWEQFFTAVCGSETRNKHKLWNINILGWFTVATNHNFNSIQNE